MVPTRSLLPKCLRSQSATNAAGASFQLTVHEAPSAGPQRSESCPPSRCCSSACLRPLSATASQETAASQGNQCRQLAHGERNRARQVVVVQNPAHKSPTSEHRTPRLATHSSNSAVSWLRTLEIVPVRLLSLKDLRTKPPGEDCRLTIRAAPSAGPRRPESCPPGCFRPRSCAGWSENEPSTSFQRTGP